MPYKDPEAKREWERQHRPRRLARRRELRQMDTARKQVRAEGTGAAKFLFPVIAGGVLAAYSPKLAIGTGGLTIAIAGLFKKGWSWWVVGVLLVVLGLFFYWSNQNEGKQSQGSEPGPKMLFL